ncbi:rRNA maturation RNase YbeY [Mycoplasma sp. 3341]|uniref:rRNA maturation RNase YbeY n=1 Tax=Mycoplasma sp. 3341 TaxID=3447506 RepID=UPI003F65A106
MLKQEQINQIELTNETDYQFKYLKKYHQILDAAAQIQKTRKALFVDLVIVDNEEMHKLNKQYRNKDYPTDILSFPFADDEMNFMDVKFLGQIIISYEKIRQQAHEYNHSIQREFCYIFAHGVMHLFGYDHQTEKEEEEMNALVDKIMDKIKVYR